jgi:hypothetical protein
MIKTRFNLICGGSREKDQLITWKNLAQIPAVGEHINVDGYPYVIASRGWSMGENDKTGEDQQYAYLRVTPLQAGIRLIEPTLFNGSCFFHKELGYPCDVNYRPVTQLCKPCQEFVADREEK